VRFHARYARVATDRIPFFRTPPGGVYKKPDVSFLVRSIAHHRFLASLASGVGPIKTESGISMPQQPSPAAKTKLGKSVRPISGLLARLRFRLVKVLRH